jgi:hypothetical protein
VMMRAAGEGGRPPVRRALCRGRPFVILGCLRMPGPSFNGWVDFRRARLDAQPHG